MKKSKKADKFINSLNEKQLTAVKKALSELEEKKWLMREPKTETIHEHKGLMCLRISTAEKWIRFFYCFSQREIVLLSGFFKKSNETPRREIEAAYAAMHALA